MTLGGITDKYVSLRVDKQLLHRSTYTPYRKT